MASVSDSFTIDVRRLRILQELQDRGTVAAAAEALHLTPSAVSQQIARISQELGGIPLLARHGRRVYLTAQARLLLAHASVIRRQMEHARADLCAHAVGEAGHVSVGGFSSAIGGLIAPAVQELARQRPGLEVTVQETGPPRCLTQLECGDLDLVVSAEHRGGPTHTDPRYDRVGLLVEPLVVALPPHHPATASDTLDLAALAHERWVMGAPDGPCADAGFAACSMAGFAPEVRHRVSEWSAALAMVAAGAGVALVPSLSLVPQPPGVCLRPLASPPAGRTLYAALRSGSQDVPTYRAVLEVLRAQARKCQESARAVTR